MRRVQQPPHRQAIDALPFANLFALSIRLAFADGAGRNL
jgi:hypothetical protein